MFTRKKIEVAMGTIAPFYGQSYWTKDSKNASDEYDFAVRPDEIRKLFAEFDAELAEYEKALRKSAERSAKTSLTTVVIDGETYVRASKPGQ